MFLIVPSQNEKRACYNLWLLWMPCLIQRIQVRFSPLVFHCLCSVLSMVRWCLVFFVFPEALLTSVFFNFLLFSFLFFILFFWDKVVCSTECPWTRHVTETGLVSTSLLLTLLSTRITVMSDEPSSSPGSSWCYKETEHLPTPERELSVLFWTSLARSLMSSVQI